MNNICVVPAKGTSTGLPEKNMRPLGGRPLLQWQLEAAKNSGVYDMVVVSSESTAIRQAATDLGFPVIKRPLVLSSPSATSNAVARHAIESLVDHGVKSPKYVTLALPTAPFTGVDGHRAVFEYAKTHVAPATHLAYRITTNPPTRSYVLDDEGRISPLTGWEELNIDQRQFHPPTYRSTYGATCFLRDYLDVGVWFPIGCRAVVVTERRQAIDIDDEFDLARARREVEQVESLWEVVTNG